MATIEPPARRCVPTLDEWCAAGRTFRFRGHDIFLRTEGSGPALLLIHGFPTASWDWCKIWAGLAAQYTLIAPDMLGFGFSSKPRGHAYRIAEQADVCLAALAEMGVTEASVLAHDYGDTVAQELLARFNAGESPVKFNSMVLLNGGLFPETHRPVLVQKLLLSPLGPLLSRFYTRDKFAQAMRQIAGPMFPPEEADLDAGWQLLSRTDGKAAMPGLIYYMVERRQQRERWVGALQQAKLPLTVIDGMSDPISGAHMVARCRELVPQADIVELAGAGHYPQLEDPGRVLPAALAGLARRIPNS